MAIILVEQGYKSTEEQNDYRTSTGITYKRQGQSLNIRKFNKNFKDRKPKCFNCNKYKHMVKEC